MQQPDILLLVKMITQIDNSDIARPEMDAKEIQKWTSFLKTNLDRLTVGVRREA